MPIQPIYLDNAEDVTNLITSLETENLLTVEDGVIKSKSALNKQFLRANDEQVYLLKDLLQYLQEADEDEIKSSSLTFFKNSWPDIIRSSTHGLALAPKEPVTLAQIKANPDLIDQLKLAEDMASFLALLNPKIYSEQPLPSLVSIEDIQKSKKVYSNEALSQTMNSVLSLMKLDDSLLELATTANRLFGQVPMPFTSADFLDPVRENIFRITLIQLIQLKSHLLNELKKVQDPQDRKELKQWIKAIEVDQQRIKDFLESIVKRLELHTQKTKEACLRYAKLLEEQPDSEINKEDLNEKEETIEELNASIKRLNLLKRVATISAMVGVGVLAMAATLGFLIVAVALIHTAPFLTLSLVLIQTLTTCLLLNPIVENIFALGTFIESKFDAIIAEKEKQYPDILGEVIPLRSDVLLRDSFDQYSSEFIKNGVDHEDLINRIVDNLEEINILDAVEQSKITHDATVDISKISLGSGSYHMFAPKRRHSSSDTITPVSNNECSNNNSGGMRVG